ncbi:ABC transporter ATP-binding protein [Streptomyces sp. ME19-01-6]|uniref:ABC transporter ATP-binding protein n=1 Tax=Streptomyces sp. ME19-01-6 TaxID=3028686 RepID=UPI0029AD45DC|nr:ABC transporter ATP-binding protein [Streptomyces sp. ME19-01-6]MDX3225234.1 ABC transporter ATP-binding protein [Streptomyces sp. ME19-01-6]
MSRYLRLGGELLRLSWRRVPGLTAGLLALYTLSIGALAAVAMCLRATVDAITHSTAAAAATAAVGLAVSYGVSAVLNSATRTLQILCVERVGLTDLQTHIYGEIGALEGLEHLERAAYLDRLTVVRDSAWGLMHGMWTGIGAAFTVAQLAVSLSLLGTVAPGLLTLVLFAAAPLWFDHKGRRAITAAELRTAELFRLQRQLFEIVTRANTGKEVKAANCGRELADRQAAVWDECARVRWNAQVTAACWKLCGWALFTAGFVGGLLAVAVDVTSGHGTPGDLVMAVTVATTLQRSVQEAVGRVTEAAATGRLVEPFLWLRDYAADARVQDSGSSEVPDRMVDGISLEHVAFTYPGTDRPALDGITVHLPAGSVVAVVGTHGSGKSTLAKLLGKFYRWDSGSIRVDGVDLAGLETQAWRSRCSAVYQDFGRFRALFSETVGLGDVRHMDALGRITRAVRDADAEDLVSRLPQGMDTQLGTDLGGVDLSEGQWQKTALARAAMRQDPLLLILDEPTASLDAPSEHEIFQRHIAHARAIGAKTGAVTVIVSHRFSTVTGADLILVLDDGKLIESGSHDDLMARGGRYAALYSLQANAYASP